MPITARQFARMPARPAFTLVELLVVMGVLAMLSSLVLVGLASAAEQARINRTRSQVQKIHELLMPRWEEYRYRRIEPMYSSDTTTTVSTAQSSKRRALYRVDRIRELMRMEMPCCKEDLTYASTTRPASNTTALWARYRRRVIDRTNTDLGTWADVIDVSDDDGWSSTHEGSECLYMILESIQSGETNGLDFFKKSEIGDTDEDGLPEILDAWGRPIVFLRWAPGYVGVRSNLHRTDAPDPLDPLGVRGGRAVDATTGANLHFPLYPLILSGGPDQIYDVAVRFTDPNDMVEQISPSSTSMAPNNPYYTPSSGSQLGVVGDGNGNGADDSLDNITNHQLIIAGNSP